MDVELLYFAGCPNWPRAQERLSQALETVGHRDVEICLRTVETHQQAQALCFPGSPAIRINGHDEFPSAGQIYGLTCRVYAIPNGFTGAPTVDQLAHALTSAR
ncbi:DF family (seleno)protein [Saccharopolyspora endophytica]|uniref:Thioredoxin family protein n=1 Tax=Saccharopolyspora endophytica TaxID=543886 RepID=A0ABS5DKD7_9PSEU|nr:thioredoxin family protein [Saccharopolyspora endophytica]MBQ0926753.1 thioredoxin family protein [Saccharopolyspora endophytica]